MESIHMEFCDVFSFPMEPNMHKDSSLMTRNICYLIDETNEKYYNDSIIRDFIKNDRFIQSEIQRKYNVMDITFYHKSSNIDAVMKMQSVKYLSDCNNDVLVEYHWNRGKFNGRELYENGNIIGADQIEIVDLTAPKEGNK